MIRYDKKIDEKIVYKKLRSGLKCYIIPKEAYNEKRAVISVKYGSVDSVFRAVDGIYESPDGVAHFLEHKLFDNVNGSAFDIFSRLGAYINAYTSFNNTAYYFSCENNFEKNLEALLGFVTEPYFTDESIRKEIGIIEQEISMYNDNPGWVAYFGMLECLYENHPAKNSIAGTKESVSRITKETLYKCYSGFYTPENIRLICAGNVDVNKTVEISEKFFTKNSAAATTVLPTEGENVFSFESVSRMNISRPVFQIGFKDRVSGDYLKRSGAYKIMLDLLIGESSRLREHLEQENLIDDSIAFDYVCGDGYGYATICGESGNPRELFDKCLAAADEIKKTGFSQEDFDRIMIKHSGRFIRGFNSIEAITLGAAELAINNYDLFDLYESMNGLELDYINALVKECFREDGCAISILEPNGGQP